MRTGLLRAIGATTAVYGVAVTRRPRLLGAPSGLPDTAAVRVCLAPLAWRDAACGLAMLLAPEGAALRTATLLRIAADFGDAVLLGRSLPGPARRAGAVAVSVGWGALSCAALWGGARDQDERAGLPWPLLRRRRAVLRSHPFTVSRS
ncbi:hypothetical protein [Streptomyces huiliensis]|uniref:hypothetical protein n=1 Tax=Streptomyces huiliensis TaxID=2876027 RepID=UPI001CBDD88A|nr:hypothetical protein [Streptomyces huiliensis]